MRLPSSTTRSDRSRAASLRAAAFLAVAAGVLAACGGTKPPDPQDPVINESAPTEKRIGTLTFHYANKSTNASMSLDLGADDVHLEMSGKPVKLPEETGRPERSRSSERRPGEGDADQARRAYPESGPERGAPAPSPMSASPRPGPEAAPPAPSPAKAVPAPRPDGLPPEDPAAEAAPDVTEKVLSGIRKAQEFFYQKRYEEALAMVRGSLDARPTAEGHALAGSIHYMLGQQGLARRHWQQALRLNPDMPAVVNMLEKTRTPGGRGSPAPRPIARPRPAPPPPEDVAEAARAAEAPFPEEYVPAAPPRREAAPSDTARGKGGKP